MFTRLTFFILFISVIHCMSLKRNSNDDRSEDDQDFRWDADSKDYGNNGNEFKNEFASKDDKEFRWGDYSKDYENNGNEVVKSAHTYNNNNDRSEDQEFRWGDDSKDYGNNGIEFKNEFASKDDQEFRWGDYSKDYENNGNEVVKKRTQDSDDVSTHRTKCGKPYINPDTFLKIVGGVEARPNSWPWQVSVQNKKEDDSYYHFCGGTIVGPRKVVSAAHCFFDNGTPISIKDVYLVAAIHSLDESYTPTSQSKKVVKLVIHPKFDPSKSGSPNDIAILTIDSDFEFDEDVQPACLPTRPVQDNTICYATGWGNIKENVTNPDGHLRQVRVPIIPTATCNSWEGMNIVNSTMCAGYAKGGKDSCQGDSGGPLVCKLEGVWELYGVVSYGAGCAKPLKPGVYTKVTSFLSFINSN